MKINYMGDNGMKFTSDSGIGFGKHLGKKLKNIPDSWFNWLMKQDFFKRSKDSYNIALQEYIAENFKKCDVCGQLTRDTCKVKGKVGAVQCFKHTF